MVMPHDKKPMLIELRTSDSITTSAAKIGEQAEIFAKKYNKSLAEVVEMLATAILGNAWVDDELQTNFLRSFGSNLECKVIAEDE